MPKTIALIKQSFRDLWSYKTSLFPVILVVMIPVVVINMTTAADQAFGAYGSFATLIMNVAAVYVILKVKVDAQKVTLSQAYYAGTARFVAFMGVVAILGLQMIPLLIGALIYITGSTGATVGLGLVEKVLLGGIWLLFGVPTFRWLTRSVFGLYFVMEDKTSPVAAVRASSQLVKQRSWSVFGRILAGTAVLFLIIIIPSLAISTLPASANTLSKVATGALQVLSALVLVPFAGLYGYNILEGLGAKPKAS